MSKIIVDKEEEDSDQDRKETYHEVDMVDFHAYSNFELYVECWRENHFQSTRVSHCDRSFTYHKRITLESIDYTL